MAAGEARRGCSEVASQTSFSRVPSRRRPLGLLLNNFTHGRNYSVYVGYPNDTPAGCDLIISRFVWDTFRESLHALPPPPRIGRTQILKKTKGD